MQETFCLLKSEAYWFGKQSLIERRVKESGLIITARWKVRLTFADVFKMYSGWIPRITTLLRFPPLFKLDVYLLKGDDAIDRMYRLKHQIRYEIWGWEYKKGGFLHAPDSVEEAREHKAIIEPRIVEVIPMACASNLVKKGQ